MRWYVSRNGETVGPVDEALVTAWVKNGMREAVVRQENREDWLPLDRSPFAKLARSPFAKLARRPQRATIVGVCFLVAMGVVVLLNVYPSAKQ